MLKSGYRRLKEYIHHTEIPLGRRIGFMAALLLVICAPRLFAASLNFNASEQYVIKGKDEVVFTFTYDPAGGEPPDSLEITLSYREGTLYNETFTDLSEGAFNTEYATQFDDPGYYDVEAVFTFTTEVNGETIIDSETLGPVKINVANWKFTAGGGLGCIESTPVVSDDSTTIYFGSEDGSLYAVDTSRGQENWRFHTGGQLDSSPALDTDGNLYFGSEDGHVYCVEPAAGALVWQFPPAGQGGRGKFFASPALDEANGRLYIGSTDNHLYALDMTDGSLEWRFKTGAKIVSSPVVGHDQTVYVGSLDSFLYALHPNGREKWRFDAGYEIRGSPALDKDGTIFVGTCGLRGEVNENNGLHAVSPAGMEHWFAPKINGFPAAPVISENGTVVVGSYSNLLYGINRNGDELSMYKTFEDDVLSSGAISANGYLFAGARDGIFYALDLDEGDQRSGRNEYWQYELSMEVTDGSPAVNNGFVYVPACKYETGALFSFVCNTNLENTGIGPSENAPWPQARNGSKNTGKTGFTADTIAPGIALTDPRPGTTDFDVERDSISVTFTMPMEPDSIYDDSGEGYYGFTVAPFEASPEDFQVTWNSEKTRFTLTLPEGSAFEPEKQYTATILSRARTEAESSESILYTYKWRFSQKKEESTDNSHDAWSCFIETLFD